MKNTIFTWKPVALAFGLIAAIGLVVGCSGESSTSTGADGVSLPPVSITNVSYDPTREFYVQYNKLFQAYWEKEKGQKVTISQSHAGSGRQARGVLEGNEADVVTLALEGDVDRLRKGGLIDEGWVNRLDRNSAPYTSTIVFLVREGNPKNIRDWDDIARPGIQVITPDPKTSGGAQWNFLAAWAFSDQKYGGDEARNVEFLRAIYANVTVLDAGARGSTTTFVENRQGDVLLAWENEAYLVQNEYPNRFEMVVPSLSILAQPSVSVVDAVVRKRGTEEVATAYLQYLYSDEAQRLQGEHHYRPSDPKILQEFANKFDLNVRLVNIDDDFGGWEAATAKFFADGKIFDQIYKK